MPFEIVSLSELNAQYRELIMLNHGSRVHHVYESVEAQVASEQACSTCQSLGRGCAEAVDSHAAGIDLLVSGSPCDPFSCQRSKRFVEGDVKAHSQYDVTMEHIIGLYKKYAPSVGIFEQVMGFLKPLSTATKETPCSRHAPESFSLAMFGCSFLLNSRAFMIELFPGRLAAISVAYNDQQDLFTSVSSVLGSMLAVKGTVLVLEESEP